MSWFEFILIHKDKKLIKDPTVKKRLLIRIWGSIYFAFY